MTTTTALSSTDLTVTEHEGMVAVVEITRPPANYFDVSLLDAIGAAYRTLDARDDVRAIVLASQGRHFCAGADFTGASDAGTFDADEGARALYAAATALFEVDTPVVAAVQGAAIGGGLGLALSADFRVAGAGTRFAANFSRLGLHHGFGISVTLPRAVGAQYAADLLLTGRTVSGEEAYRMGLCDRLVDDDDIRAAALRLATDLAGTAPLAARSIRRTLRRGLRDAVAAAVDHERAEQAIHRATADFAEGVSAASDRRTPRFTGS